ncbi:Hypothetical protein CINCED_3A007970 [Cinara cedri]|nr:Hypothetical protein CINCED_3A007970 [Cinara cedri]
MAKFVLPSILVCLVISNNVNWGVSGIEGDTDLNSLKDTVKEKIDSIADFDQFKDTIPIDEGERIMKEKCEKNNPNNNNTYNETLEARKELEDCARGIVNITELKNEINVAKPKGDIDMVFKKYCKKSPEFKDCMTNYTSTIDVCLDASEKDTEHILMVVTEALLSFVCHDEGDRIALFYSEGGPDCLMDKKEALQHCLNKSFSKYTPNSEPSANLANLPSFKFEEEQCK